MFLAPVLRILRAEFERAEGDTSGNLLILILVVFVGSFVTAAVAGLFGALITKKAPVT